MMYPLPTGNARMKNLVPLQLMPSSTASDLLVMGIIETLSEHQYGSTTTTVPSLETRRHLAFTALMSLSFVKPYSVENATLRN